MNNNSPVSITKKYFYISFFLVFIWIIFYVSWISWVLSFIFSICIYSLITYFIYKTWKSIRKKTSLDFLNFWEYFVYKVSVWLSLSILILWGLSYYKNEINPTPMPTYYLSNWEKQVVFQAMSHIGSEKFYKSIQVDLKQKKQNWYVYYFEWVKPGSKENMDKFDDAIWVKFDKNLYENFSKLYWVVHQDNSIFFNLVNDKDYNIDLTIDEIMKFYEDNDTPNPLAGTSPLQEENAQIKWKTEVMDLNSEIIKTLASLNDKELSILRYINKALLNFIIGSENTQNIVMDNFANKKLFGIILDKRNEVLSTKIINSDDKKIFITYWLLHFKWVFEILKKSDSNWEITKTDLLYPIQ